jgi:short-subunit dehydrogenase
MPTALITGASAGLGAAFAVELATSHDLVLVARDGGRLNELAASLNGAAASRGGSAAQATSRGGSAASTASRGGSIEVIAADLTTDKGCDLVAERLSDPDRPIDLLVNNAGRSLNTSFVRSTVEKEESLLRLNVHAVMRLSLAVLPGMIERRRGAVINVSSVSGFGSLMPGSTYPASKAWVTSFSESTAMSVRPFGVRVMALCPGYVRTEFHQRAGIDMSKTPEWLWLDAGDVVRTGLRDLGRGKMISVPDWKYKLTVFGIRHLPSRMLHRVARDTRGRIGRDEK